MEAPPDPAVPVAATRLNAGADFGPARRAAGPWREFGTLMRAGRDFIRGFRALHFVGPCVTDLRLGALQRGPSRLRSWRARSAPRWRGSASR